MQAEHKEYNTYISKPRQSRLQKSHPAIGEFTRDEGYLHQYYLLRSKSESGKASLSALFAQAEEVDKKSHILVVRKGNHVIAGARLTVTSPRQPLSLPLESDNLKLHQLLPAMRLEHQKYAEISGIVAEIEFYTLPVVAMLFKHLNRKMLAMDISQSFGICNLQAFDFYRKSAHLLGYTLSAPPIGNKILPMHQVLFSFSPQGVKASIPDDKKEVMRSEA